jgi:UDPglucose--hexose-1-phosphate uridylyltransferase
MAPSRDDPTTSEMRHDWLTDRWVIVAPQRAARPVEFVHQPPRIISKHACPFCQGHEHETPAAVACYVDQGHAPGKSWHVRVVPNKFPAVSSPEAVLAVDSNALAFKQLALNSENSAWKESGYEVCSASAAMCSELYQRRFLSGGHEVIIEGPEHLQSLSQLDLGTASLVFKSYRDRLAYWLTEQALAYAVVFKNVGEEAGASLVHSHSQLIATDLVPTDILRAAQRMDQFFEQKGECLFCRTVREEIEQGLRIVEQTPDFVAYCPFASRLPALVTITSGQHCARFEALPDRQLEQLAELVHRTIRRLEQIFSDVAYNYVVHTAPASHQGSAAFHWRMDLFPRISTKAGFEWGSECFINPLTPENSAEQLRSVRL